MHRLRFPPIHFLLASILAACSTGPGRTVTVAPHPEPTISLRVVSFNVDGEGGRDGVGASWDDRKEGIMAAIGALRPHLLGLQEVFRPQLDAIQTALPGFDQVGRGALDGGVRGEYTAILYDRSRLELLAEGTFWISEFPDTPGSRHFGNAVPRTATWARLRDREGGRVFLAVNVRMDDRSEPSREMGMEVLQERILSLATAAGTAIVMGDFGADERARPFRVLLMASVPPLHDPFRVLHPDATGVGTRHGHRGGGDGDRTDAILTTGHFIPLEAGVHREGWTGVPPSDHAAVWAALAWRQ